MTLYMAIAREEGFYVSDSRAQRNNNPGNLEWGAFTQAQGATSGDPRFAIFPTAEAGFAALHSLFLTDAYQGLTLEAALNKYAPRVENNTNSYVDHVCTWLACLPSTPLASLLEAQ